MAPIKLGISLKSLALPFRRSLPAAQALGVRAIELEATGELAPQKLTETGRREIRHLLRSHDLEVCAVHCPLRFGLDVPDNLQQRLDHIRDTVPSELCPVHRGSLQERAQRVVGGFFRGLGSKLAGIFRR